MKKKIANWGNYPKMEAEDNLVTFTEDIKSSIVSFTQFIPRGNGRCYGDASLAEQTITTTNYNNVLSFDEKKGVFECESGITLDQVLDIIVPKGWFLPVTPGTKFITIGGAVASDVHGKNHHVDGCFSSHIYEMNILLSDGTIIACGPSLNIDLYEATCGGMGLTGVITKVIFQLKKIESSFISQKQIKAENLDEVIYLFEKYKSYTYSVAWIDCLQKGKSFGRSILMLGEHTKFYELPEKLKANPLSLPKTKQVKLPFYLPSFFLNKFTVKIFNTLFYGKNLKKEIDNIVSFEPFFYPLDVVLDWNKGYGRKGFIQYQFVIPLESKDGLIEILKRISNKGLGSFLAVLKVFGKQDSLISFPMEGYTLALDIPIRKNLFLFLDEIDELVLKYGGRLYMSKDARMKSSILNKSYPRLQEFKSIIRKYDSESKLHSLLSDRLELTRKLS
jgi:decaprenylphospho-beta-D-ribofuranose 2-oxidase